MAHDLTSHLVAATDLAAGEILWVWRKDAQQVVSSRPGVGHVTETHHGAHWWKDSSGATHTEDFAVCVTPANTNPWHQPGFPDSGPDQFA